MTTSATTKTEVSNSAQRIELAGVPVDAVTMQGSVDIAKQAIVDGRQLAVLAVNPEKVIAARSQPQLLAVLRSAELLIPDGIGAVIAARLKGAKISSRVPGAELMPELCAMAAVNGFPIFLFGASETVNSEVAKVLESRYPGLEVAGRQNGYVSDSEANDVVNAINASGAKLLFIALGSPKQENFISSYRDKLSVNILQGVGGTFDVMTGNVKRAPEAWRKLNLEWLYRLLSQPQRLLRQTALPKFVLLMIREWLGFAVAIPKQSNH